jgi:pyruvate/2-oxoglutarate dehydrogenase complex dihydrolipoamide dehydrogenase (E3) component
VSFGATAPMSCSREEPELSTAPDRAKSDSADVIVLGMGVGGEDVAERLARAGLDVIGIDGNLVGGECPYWGCVPSKMMIRAANLLTEGRRIPGLAGRSTVTADWAPVAQRIRDEATDNWDDTAAVERFEGKGGRFVRGWGRLDGPGRVIVDDRVLSARRAVVVNTGTKASVPPIDGLEGTPYWINRQAIESEAVPASLVVLGGGAVGAELGQVFARFGSAVSIIEEADRLLPPEEPEAGTVMAEVFGRDGIAVHLSTQATAVVHDGRRFAVETDRAGVVGGERLLVATYQADIVVRQILGEPVTPADYRAVPRVTFTDPEVGSVGLTEAAARAQGIDVRTGSAPVSKSARGWIHKAGNDGFIKLVEDAGRGCLVGATSCGPVGGEVLGLLTLAVHEAVPTEHLRHMIYAYPTFHRGILDAIAALAR